MSSAYSVSIPSNSAVDPLSELNGRLRSLQDEIEYYTQLRIRAQNALESHRSDLTLLQQKERAIFVAKEDDLRLQLHEALRLNRKALVEIEETQRKVQQELSEELLATRSEGSTTLNSLQEKLDALWRERLKLERDLTHLESKTKKLKGAVRNDLYEQSRLHTELQEAKQALLDTLHKPSTTERSCSARSKSVVKTPTLLRTPTLASPHRLESPKKHFIPSGPTIPRGRIVSSSRHRGCQCCFVRSDFSPRRAEQHRRDRSVNIPESHNLVSMVSTLERRNYLRPRAYLQHRGRDMGYQSSSIKIVGCTPLPLAYASPEAVNTESVESPPQGPGKEASVETPGARAAENKSAASVPSSSSVSDSVGVHRRASPAPEYHSHRKSYIPRTSSHLKNHTKSSDPSAPGAGSASHIADGLALDAACQTLKEEIAELEKAYAVFYEQLHDPHCDSVAASQQMRQLMVAIDRKADQLRTLRFQQQKHQERLRIHHVLKQVERENSWCEQVYSSIVHLSRVP